MMTPDQEIGYIHSILDYLNKLDDRFVFDYLQGIELFHYSELDAHLLQERMEEEKLVKITNQRGQPDTAELTNKGKRIANESGGYKERQAALQREKDRQQGQIDEQLRLNRISANAAVRSARWALFGLFIAIASVLASLYIAWQAEEAQDATNLRVTQLEQQLTRLEAEPTSVRTALTQPDSARLSAPSVKGNP
ncbi:hypothetical protein H8B13_09035 [Hymenobacter sp. BT188]|uniref:hypothetical protein n=1 Tax=Hymenobacter sp. BT188 TaxID=2763504 RepID=UPI0016517AC3|nr:hypothetical protein [Hymenobacter sp. BT188]MBC6606960.1 hypothetical protein [Hymenobacter sp. BT188]